MGRSVIVFAAMGSAMTRKTRPSLKSDSNAPAAWLVDLPPDSDTVVVRKHGISVAFNADGSVDVLRPRPRRRRVTRDTIHFSVPSKQQRGSNAKQVAVGDRMPDGSVFAGVSPDTGRPFFVAEKDAPLTLTWRQAVGYAEDMGSSSSYEWRLPTKAELNTLFLHRAKIPGLRTNGVMGSGHYWTEQGSVPFGSFSKSFGDGAWYWRSRDGHASIRLVRN